MMFLEDENEFLEDPAIMPKLNLTFLSTVTMKVKDELLLNSTVVSGAFDGLCYEHWKLLTLAASSDDPINGKVLTRTAHDGMLSLKNKVSTLLA